MDRLPFHHVAISVTDIERSQAFYQEVFGLELSFSEDNERRKARILGFPGGLGTLGLVQHIPGAGSPGRAFDPTVTGLDHLAFTVGTREELDGWAERLTAKGIDHSGALEVPPGWILNFKDPDGIALALFVDRS